MPAGHPRIPSRARRVAPGRWAPAIRGNSGFWSRGPAFLLLIALVGLVLRLGFLGDSLYGDEVGAFYDVSGHGLGRVIYLLSGHSPELNPPLYFVVAWLSEQLLGTSAESIRLVSLVSGALIVPLTYGLVRMVSGVRAGLIAAALIALSPFLIFYSSEARPYSLMLALTLASTVALLKAIRVGTLGWWAAYATASCAAMYTHFTAIFPLLVSVVWCLAYHRSVCKPLIIANTAAAVAFLPWLPNLIRTAHSPGTRLYGLLEPLTLHAVRVDLVQTWIGYPLIALARLPGPIDIAIALAGVAVAAGTFGFANRSARTSTPRPSPGLVLLAALAFAVPLCIGVYSALRPSVWNGRDLITALPGLAGLVATLLAATRALTGRLALTLVLAALAVAAVKMRAIQYHRPDYQAVADLIKRESTGGEPVVNWPDLTPGPPNELEAALQLNGSYARHPVFRLGAAPLAAVVRAKPYAAVPAEPGEVVARQAAQLARNGKLFLVLPAAVSISTLQELRQRHISSTPSSNILVLLAAFMGALPDRFRPESMRVFDGLHQATVYVFDG